MTTMKATFRLLVCGSRDWQDKKIISEALDAALAEHPDLVLIEGEAPGADRIAAQWAEENGLATAGRLLRYKAHWRHSKDCPRDCTEVQGLGAGPIRNRRMLREGKPTAIYAFHPKLMQSAGTLNMCYQAAAEAVPVVWWDEYGFDMLPTPRQIGDWYRAHQERKRARKGLDNRNRMF